MDSFSQFISGLDWSVPLKILASVIPALLCITLHELGHGYVAYRLGDDTAKRAGRLTLNPIKHIDVLGLVMMIVFKFGWAKPVPVNMYRFKNPKRGMALCALAGPAVNLLLSCLFLFIYGLIYIPCSLDGGQLCKILLETVYLTAYLSLALAIFNLIPIPPLDGSKILFSLMSDSAYMKLMRYEKYGMLVLLLLVATNILGNPLQNATLFVIEKIFIIAQWAYSLCAALV